MVSGPEASSRSDVSADEVLTPFGPLSSGVYARLFPDPIARIVEWPWAEPFPAILVFCGYTIHDIVRDRHAAAETRVLWKIWKAAERIRDQRLRTQGVELILWWRSLGCPVECPVCGAGGEEACGCGRGRLRSGTGQIGLDSGGAIG